MSFRLAIVVLLYYVPSLLFSDLSASVRDSVDFYMSRLDAVLEEKDGYERLRLDKIADAKKQLHSLKETDTAKLYDLYTTLFDQYQYLCFDSAFVYAKKIHNLALRENNADMERSALLMLAYCNDSAGLFLEAKDYLAEIDSTKISPLLKQALYSCYSKLYLDMALSIGISPYEQLYLDKSVAYSKAIIDLHGNRQSLFSKIQELNIYRCRGDYGSGIKITGEILKSPDLDERSRALCLGTLAMFHLAQGDTVKGVDYLTETAIYDVKLAVKESSALADLADIAYKYGFIDRAYYYITLSMDNAISFNARHRKLESGEILPIIESNRYEIERQGKNRLFVALSFVVMLLVSLVVAIYFILRQVRQLKARGKLILQKNNDLRASYKKLREASVLKEKYIGYFFGLNRKYMSEMERFKLAAGRKLAARQYSELQQFLKSGNTKQDKEAKFAIFDQMFLKLFPGFVSGFNELFEEQFKVELPSPSMLTPELRIFALIRLGVTDNEKIAEFLNYSVNTINTYKTKVKNRSIVPNTEFEKHIMKIESFSADEEPV